MSTTNLKTLLLVPVVFLLLPVSLLLAQAGKLAGTVSDAETGDPIPGANVIVEETTIGATTNAEGQYTILNIPPGTYNVRATFVGYADQIQQGVNVDIDLTTELNFELQEATEQLDEVTVQAQEEVVKPDVSANVINLSSEDYSNLPVNSIETLIGLQAGVRGLSVRGGNASSMQFRVDGVRMFDGRSHRPFTGVSYTAIEEVQVQTGGFNAEYGNLRSGLVNVSLKDGPRNRYTFDVLARYKPPNEPYSGPISFNDDASYFKRPYLDDPDIPNDSDPAYVGMKPGDGSVWDQYDRVQYPTWDGWNEYAETHSPELTPEQWQEVFRHYHRKDFEIKDPEYTIDGSIGGPVPGISDPLGDLRFFASYRQEQNPYQIPMLREVQMDRLGRLKLTSNVGYGMQLEVQGMLATNRGHDVASNIAGNAFTHVIGFEHMFFSDSAYPLRDVDHQMLGGELTHTLSPNTFYEIKVNRMTSDYLIRRPPARENETIVKSVGGLDLTEAPFGWGSAEQTEPSPTGMLLGGVYSQDYDTSSAQQWNFEFDLTHQLSQFIQLKAGADLLHSQNDRKTWFLSWQSRSVGEDWNRSVLLGAAYAQTKLEFEGLIANTGLRLDYFDPIGNWFAFAPFDEGFRPPEGPDQTLEDRFRSRDSGNRVALSPRLGISFPITVNSKLFFNYGHFRELMEPGNIFRIDRIGSVGEIGNPRHPLPKTVSYEIGYEQNLFNQFLVRLTGYYKDLAEQPLNVSFVSDARGINYDIALPYSYEDIRGFETSITRVTGSVRGFANFTFMSRKGGRFGWSAYQENIVRRGEYRRDARNTVFSPVPRPYANVNISFLAPRDFGPNIGGVEPLGDWRLGVLGQWRQGQAISYCGGQGCPSGVEDNLRWRDDYGLDLRLTKNFNLGLGQAQFFMDVSNVLNIKELNTSGSFQGAFVQLNDDWERYMKSLHLPAGTFDEVDPAPLNIPGDDRPGDFRDPEIQFVPIEKVSDLPDEGMSRTMDRYGPLYWQASDGQYYLWNEGSSSFEPADAGKVDQVLDDKAYIDMPNLRAFTFLNPRSFIFGVRVTF